MEILSANETALKQDPQSAV